jgi:dipeptidyl aminopeptidase/acylaminoacyl peptidase
MPASTPITAESLYQLTFVSDPQISPDGSRAAVVRTRAVPAVGDGDRPGYRSDVLVVDLRSGDRQILARASGDVGAPRWSDAGDLAVVVADDSRTRRLALVDGGSLRPVSAESLTVQEYCWLRGSGCLALVAAPADGGPIDDRYVRIDRRRYKTDGVPYTPPRGSGLYRQDAAGSPVDVPVLPLEFGASDLVASADGGVLFCAPADEAEFCDDRRTIWRADPHTGTTRRLLASGGFLSRISPSPDATQVAFIGAADPVSYGNPDALWILDAASGAARLVTRQFNAAPSVRGDARYGRYPNAPQWMSGSTVLVNRNRDGASGLTEVDLESGGCRDWESGPDCAVTAFTASPTGAVAFIRESPTAPGELYLASAGGPGQAVSDENAEFRAAHDLRPAELVERETGDDRPVRYWAIRPTGERTDRAIALLVHSGSQTLFGYGFLLDAQLLAARGFTVVYSNPHDAGRPLEAPIAPEALAAYRTEQFTRDYPAQVLAVVRDASEIPGGGRRPVHLTGGSSGGYLTNWLVSHSDVFRSAVTQRSISNLVSFYGTSDVGPVLTEGENGGNPWADFDVLWNQSPLKYAAAVNTPILIMHSEQDHRCPLGQAEEWFTALKRIGKVDVSLMRFREEGHELSRSGRPDRRIARLRGICDWFESH